MCAFAFDERVGDEGGAVDDVSDRIIRYVGATDEGANAIEHGDCGVWVGG